MSNKSAVEMYVNPQLIFTAIPQCGAAEYFHSDSGIFERLRGGGVRRWSGNPRQPYTHTLHQLTVSTVKGMCLSVIDALSVM